jgi:hypothetical protein
MPKRGLWVSSIMDADTYAMLCGGKKGRECDTERRHDLCIINLRGHLR